jgi:hypothetical protein
MELNVNDQMTRDELMELISLRIIMFQVNKNTTGGAGDDDDLGSIQPTPQSRFSALVKHQQKIKEPIRERRSAAGYRFKLPSVHVTRVGRALPYTHYDMH